MLECYTLTRDNLISKGISVKTDLIENLKYMSAHGQLEKEYIKIYGEPENSRVIHGELFNLIFKEQTNESTNIEGTLVTLNWESKLKGGIIINNLRDRLEAGDLEVITQSKRYEGLTLDFSEKLFTNTYIVKINRECKVEYQSMVMCPDNMSYISGDSYRITFSPNREPRIVRICHKTSSYIIGVDKDIKQ